ncbi:MAG TPA: efflux RND transporter periplasmic adaptor subunit [Vicinamibacterales bacterium]|nr:efflux RND transporter periplasmic adaptor subunit [Vicinamibacterales bacterium]
MPRFSYDYRPAGRALSIITLLAFAGLPLRAVDAADAALSSEATLTVNSGKVEATPFTRYLSINGTVNAWQDVIIAPEVGGYRVEDVLVDVGDYVQAGQELVRLSTSILETELASREAALKQREAQAENARLAFERAQAVAERNLLSDADLDRLNSETLTAIAAVDAAKADLEAARTRLKFATVTAPDAGLITARNVTVGQLAQAGGEMLRLLRQNRVEWRGEVPEATLPSLQVGQNVTITSVDGREHEGTIRVVSPTVDPVTHNGLVYVDIEADTALRPGMFARGRIEFDQSEALLVPLDALVSSDGYNYVFVIQSDRTVRRQMIQTGTIQGEQIEVIGGLEPGANIVTSGAGFLKDGDLVNVVGKRAGTQ